MVKTDENIENVLYPIFEKIVFNLDNNIKFSEKDKDFILEKCSKNDISFDEWFKRYIIYCGCCNKKLLNKSLEENFDYFRVYDMITDIQERQNCFYCDNYICEQNCIHYLDICDICCGVTNCEGDYIDLDNLFPCLCDYTNQNNYYHNNGFVCLCCIKKRCKDYEKNKEKCIYYNHSKHFRKKILQEYFDNYKIQIREDSFLCITFIEKGIIVLDSLDSIAKRMAEMKYLYKYTDYPKLIPYFNQKESEMKALDKKEYPKIFPWIRLRERILFLWCNLNLPPDLTRHICCTFF